MRFGVEIVKQNMKSRKVDDDHNVKGGFGVSFNRLNDSGYFTGRTESHVIYHHPPGMRKSPEPINKYPGRQFDTSSEGEALILDKYVTLATK